MHRSWENNFLTYFQCQPRGQIGSLFVLGQPCAETAGGAFVFLVDLVVGGEVEGFDGFGLQCD